MDFVEAKHAAAREIALAFGVPPLWEISVVTFPMIPGRPHRRGEERGFCRRHPPGGAAPVRTRLTPQSAMTSRRVVIPLYLFV